MSTGPAIPGSVAAIASLAANGQQPFDVAVREFLDAWQFMDAAAKGDALRLEPCPVARVQDAYLAGLAEHLATKHNLPVPGWTEQASRFLDAPFFAGGLQSLKAVLIAESPAAFRRRLIFISADALSRPRREFAQNSPLNISNLDV